MDVKSLKLIKIDVVICITISVLLLLHLISLPKIYSIFCSFNNGNIITRDHQNYDISRSNWYIAKELEHSYILKSFVNERSLISMTVFKENNYYPSEINEYWNRCKNLQTYKINNSQKIATCIPTLESRSKNVGMAMLNDKDILIAMTMEYNPNQNDAYASLLNLIN